MNSLKAMNTENDSDNKQVNAKVSKSFINRISNPDAKPLDFYERRYLSYAARDVVEALGETYNYRVMSKACSALGYLKEFINQFTPSPDYSPNGAKFSSAAHTYLRKCADGAAARLLYTFMRQDVGKGVWVTFCNDVAETNGHNVYESINEANNYASNTDSNQDNALMMLALETFGKEAFDSMIEYFTDEENGNEDPWDCGLDIKKYREYKKRAMKNKGR